MGCRKDAEAICELPGVATDPPLGVPDVLDGEELLVDGAFPEAELGEAAAFGVVADMGPEPAFGEGAAFGAAATGGANGEDH